jgi:hypothetical protein
MKDTDCKGVFVPQYRSSKHTQKNPFYLAVKDASLAGVNTTDEFITTEVYYEVESICLDCRKSNCEGVVNDSGSKKENGLQ